MTTQTKTVPMTYQEALVAALREEMRRDPKVHVLGYYLPYLFFGIEDPSMVKEFGEERIIRTPISEASFTGMGVGAAMAGLRMVVDLLQPGFIWLAMDQLVNQAAKNRYLFGGQCSVPAVFVSAMNPGSKAGAHHTERQYPVFMHIPGFKVIAPSTPYDMKGLFKSAIRDPDPVMVFLDNSAGPRWGGRRHEVPVEDYTIPLGQAAIRQVGKDITLVTVCWLHRTMEAAEALTKEGISVEVIEPRSLKPLDMDTILTSVRKTGRLVIVDISHRVCGAAAEISATIAEDGFEYLKAPIIRITVPDVHIPASAPLDDAIWPSRDRIVTAVKECLSFRGPVRS